MKTNILFLSIIFTILFKFSDAQIIYTIVGTGVGGYNGDGISASSAQISSPSAVAVDTAGNVYIADQVNFRIRKVTPSGVISTIGGNGVYGYSGDGGPATSAMITGPYDIHVDRLGNVYFADNANQRVRKISTSGIITTVAGTGTAGYNGDGILASTARLNSPGGVVVDSIGNIYIGDATNNRIRKINTSGIISTFAGTGVSGSLGDGGLATAAQFYAPGKMGFDKFGNLYVADNGNRKVRKITVAGIITTVAGTGMGGSTGDGGPATSATFTYPFGISVDTTGNVYIDDYSNRRVRKVNTSGIISTYAGTGGTGFSGDGGPPASAQISPQGSTSDKYGNLFVADLANHRIRKIIPSCVTPNPPTSTTSSLNVCSGQTKVLSVLDPGLIRWYAFPTGGTVLGTGLTFTSPTLTADTTFYAEITTCATSATRTAFPLTVQPLPIVTSSNDTTICNGSPIILNGGGATSYAWTGGVTNGISFSPTSSATYTVTGTSSFGCTGTTTTIVTVTTPNPSFTTSGATLTANVSSAIYQWYDCTASSIISGATNQVYTATASGSYALIITQTSCVDTSACQSVSFTGIDNNALNAFNIYPNPANDKIEIETGIQNLEFKIYNSIGKLVLAKNESSMNSKTTIDVSGLFEGIYLVVVKSQNGYLKSALVIQR